MRRAAVAAGVCLVLATGCGKAEQAESTTTTTTTTTTTSTTTTTTPTTTTTSLDAQMRQWAATHIDSVSAMDDALGQMSDAASRGDVYGFGLACQAMHNANEDVQASLPSPDPTLTAALQAAVDDYDTAAHFCESSVEEISPSLLVQVNTYMQKANAHMDEALAAIAGAV